RPRTPSVPKRRTPSFSTRARRSALRELRGATGLAEPVLLALHDPGVAGEHPGLLQLGPQLGLELDESTGDAETESVRLAGDAAALQGGVDVVSTLGLGDLEGLHHPQPNRHAGEVVL